MTITTITIFYMDGSVLVCKFMDTHRHILISSTVQGGILSWGLSCHVERGDFDPLGLSPPFMHSSPGPKICSIFGDLIKFCEQSISHLHYVTLYTSLSKTWMGKGSALTTKFWKITANMILYKCYTVTYWKNMGYHVHHIINAVVLSLSC